MIISPAQLPDWTSQNAELLEAFLRSETGAKLLDILAFQIPEPFDGADVNRTLVRSGLTQGYGRAVETVFSLTKFQPAAPVIPPAYPSLDDESQWDDAPIVNF